MNNCVFTGRLCQQPELQVSNAGTEYCKFSIAVQRDTKDKSTGQYGVDFVPVTVFGKTAAFVDKYFQKGDGMTVRGRMESSTYADKETGKKRTSWALNAEKVEFALSRKGQAAPDETAPGYPAQNAPIPDGATQFAEIDDSDGELPW